MTQPTLATATAQAFIGVSALAPARAFYETVLGLNITDQTEYALIAEAGGVTIRITLVGQVIAAPYTVLGFTVPDLPATLQTLAANGVSFERYAFLTPAQTKSGIWHAPDGTQIAWFKDPDGNLLSLAQPPS